MSKSRNPLALFENLSLKSLLTIMFFLLIGIVGLWRISQKPKQVSAEWFDESYSYRRSITLTNSGIGQTNVYITLSGLDTSDTSRFQADAGDIRFTDNSGSLLNYFIVSGAGTSNTIIHVNFDNLLVGKSTIYLYYGNPSAQNGFSASDFTTAASDLSIDSPASEQVSPAPIAYWKFDEGVGTTAHDSTSNANHGALGSSTASPSWIDESQCLSGKCLRFDGGDTIIVGNKPDLNFERTNSFSISTWFKTSSSTQTSLVSKMFTSPTYAGYELQLNIGGDIRFYLISDYSGGNYILTGTNDTYNDNQWHHVVVTYNGNSNASGITIYIDSQVAAQTISRNTLTSSIINNNNVRLGSRDSGSYYFQGYLDEVKIYNYARTASQILSDYNSGLAGQSSSDGSAVAIGGDNTGQSLSNGLIGYWKFDEGIGTTSTDASSNSNLATFGTGTSAPTWGSGKYGIGISLDGTNDYASLSIASTTPTSGTISMWVNPTSTSLYDNSPYFQNNDIYFWSQIYASPTSNFIRLRLNTTSGLEYINAPAPATPQLNQWSNIVATWQQNPTNITVNIYINSQLVKSAQTTGTPAFNRTSASLGNYSSRYFHGLIDETRLYNRALSPTEVKQLYQYAPGPIGYWKFDEGTNNSISDTSGLNHTGIWTGTGSHWTVGKYGKSGNFNGTDDAVTINTTPQLRPIQLTISAWIYQPSAGNMRAIVDKETDGYRGYYFYTNNSRQLSFLASSSTATSTSSFNLNQWNHVSVTFANGLTTFYINGVMSGGSTAVSNISWASTPNLTIGSGGYGSGTDHKFIGKIDEVKIYNYARSAKQIQQDMNAGNPMSSKSMIAHYKFDEGYGSIANNSGSIGSTANGTLASSTSSPTWTTNGKINKALSFDGGDYVTFGTTNDFNFGTNSFAFSLWAKFGSTRVVIPISKNTSGYAEPGYRLYINSTDRMELSVTDGTNSCGYYSPAITNYLNKWTHYTGVWNSENKTCSLYADGTFLGRGTNNSLTSTSNTTRSLTLGRNAGGGYGFQGQIDEVKIYNYALTADEIKKDYNQGSTFVFGSTSQTIGATTTSLDYCLPGDPSACSGPVAEWKMDEGVGTTAYDTSGNNHNGTWNGTGTHWAAGKIGKAAKFNISSSDFINMGNSLNISGPLTIDYWFKPDYTLNTSSPGSHQFLFSRNGWMQNSFRHDSGSISFSLGNSSSVYFTPTSWAPTWTHVTIIYDGSSLKGYLNGILDVTSNQSGIGFTNTDNLYIGQYLSESLRFDGLIDQVRIYDYARTPAQIAYDYNRGAPIAHYKLDECQGTVAHDASGNNFHGTLSIGALGTQTTPGTCSTSGAWYNGATGKINSSLNFDGSDDSINLGSSSTFALTSYSISGWFKTSDKSDYKAITSRNLTNNNRSWWVSIWKNNTAPHVGGSLVFRNSSGGALNLDLSSGIDHADGNWHHFVAVLNGSTEAQLYVDGNLKASDNSISPVDTPSASAIIGNDPLYAGRYFPGQIDDVRIYNYALTSTQVKTLFNDGAINFSN